MLAGVLVAGAASTPAAAAPAAAEADRDQADRALIEQLTAARAADLARERKRADDRELEKLEKLEEQDKALRAALAKVSATRAQLDKTRRQRDELARERRALVDELTARDRLLEAEVTAYREAVTKLAETPNAKKRAALQRYADGDRIGGFAVLEDITRAENDARAKTAAIANAANLRELAALAYEMKDRGEKTTAEVVALYEEITKLDAGVMLDWALLSLLHDEAGRLSDAKRAAEAAEGLASTLAEQRSDAGGRPRGRQAPLREEPRHRPEASRRQPRLRRRAAQPRRQPRACQKLCVGGPVG